ncbi:MAG: CHAD domain-containing protein [Bacteroidetes bacterium]|nr:CHAD domain-containing protein [Bacteroidota bacterium]
MEVESKYIVRQAGAFSALLAAKTLGGYRLEPLASVQVHDTYLDTAAGDLLNQGYVLRLRKQGDDVLATLKSMGGAEGPLHRRIEIEATVDQALDEEGRLDLPEGPLQESLEQLIGDAALAPLLQFRQYRSPRVVFDGKRLVGVLSLDVIATETEVGPDVSHQVEVELAEDGRETDIYRLDPILKELGLEDAESSKFARGLVLLQRSPATAILLLPEEQAALRKYQEAGTPLLRRRARILLLSARGLNPSAVANKVGLSLLRVEHWVDAFRRRRMDIFEDATTHRGALLGASRVRRYDIAELVSAGPPVPSLFSSDGHLEQKWAGLTSGHANSPRSPNDSDGDGTDASSEIVREESIEVERYAADPLSAVSMGDGAGGRPPIVEERAEAGAMIEDSQMLVPPEPEVRHVKAAAPEQVPVVAEIATGVDIRLSTTGAEDAGSTKVTAPVIPIPERPVLGAEDSVLSAAERVLRYQYAWHADAVKRVADAVGEPRSIRRLLIAVHRLRIALQLFSDYLPPTPVQRLHQGLRGMARSLDALSDLDHCITHVASARAEASKNEAIGFGVVLDSLNEERQAAWEAVHVRLGNAAHAQWTHRLEMLLEWLVRQVDEGVGVGEFSPSEPDNYLESLADPPKRTRLQHMLGSAVWRRYEGLRAFDSTVGAATDDLLHPLGVACASMQYVLALTSGCSEEPIRDVSGPMARLESHLAMLHHARLTADTLDTFADVDGVANLRDRLRDVQTEVITEVAEMWGALIEPTYRQSLARIVASL